MLEREGPCGESLYLKSQPGVQGSRLCGLSVRLRSQSGSAHEASRSPSPCVTRLLSRAVRDPRVRSREFEPSRVGCLSLSAVGCVRCTGTRQHAHPLTPGDPQAPGRTHLTSVPHTPGLPSLAPAKQNPQHTQIAAGSGQRAGRARHTSHHPHRAPSQTRIELKAKKGGGHSEKRKNGLRERISISTPTVRLHTRGARGPDDETSRAMRSGLRPERG